MVIGDGRQFWDKKYVSDIRCEDAIVGRKVVLTIQVGRNSPPRQMTIGLYVVIPLLVLFLLISKNDPNTDSMRSHQKRVTTSSCYHNPTDRTRPQYSIVSFLDSCVRVVTTSFPTAREEDPSTVIVSRTRTFVFSILARVPCRWRMLDRTRTGLNFSYVHSLHRV